MYIWSPRGSGIQQSYQCSSVYFIVGGIEILCGWWNFHAWIPSYCAAWQPTTIYMYVVILRWMLTDRMYLELIELYRQHLMLGAHTDRRMFAPCNCALHSRHALNNEIVRVLSLSLWMCEVIQQGLRLGSARKVVQFRQKHCPKRVCLQVNISGLPGFCGECPWLLRTVPWRGLLLWLGWGVKCTSAVSHASTVHEGHTCLELAPAVQCI